jgi:hypothetical protein
MICNLFVDQKERNTQTGIEKLMAIRAYLKIKKAKKAEHIRSTA